MKTCSMVSTKILSSTTLVNADNKRQYLHILRISEGSCAIKGINDILQIELTILIFFMYFWFNKCSLGGRKNQLQIIHIIFTPIHKDWKTVLDMKIWRQNTTLMLSSVKTWDYNSLGWFSSCQANKNKRNFMFVLKTRYISYRYRQQFLSKRTDFQVSKKVGHGLFNMHVMRKRR